MSFELGEFDPRDEEVNDWEGEGNDGEDDLESWWDDYFDRDQVFPDGSHHDGVELEFTNEDLPNDSNRPDIQQTNRRKRNLVYRDVDDMFEDILDLEADAKNPKFIDWMIDRGFAIRRVFSESGFVADYEVRTKGATFKTIGRALTQEDYDVLREDIRGEFDYYTEENNRRVMKKAGIATAIGLSTIALITGLALGLKRKGKDIIADAKRASKTTPGKKTIPWSTIEEATGGSLVFIGDNLYLILGGGALYVVIRRAKNT